MRVEEQQEQWQSFIKGSNKAFEQLYVQHVKLLFRYGLHLTGNRELLEDVIHDLFVYLHDKRSSLPQQVDSVQAYLLISFRRRLMRRLKEEIPSFTIEILPERELATEKHAGSNIEEKEAAEEKKQLVSYINETLTPRQKQLLYLRYREQLGFKEIASIMEITTQSAKNLMQKTLQKMREAILSKSNKRLKSIS
jgi:RNA polymerase sigma factor (sigma-70 family)